METTMHSPCSFYNITSLVSESDLFSNINVLKNKIRINLYLHVKPCFIYGYGMKCIWRFCLCRSNWLQNFANQQKFLHSKCPRLCYIFIPLKDKNNPFISIMNILICIWFGSSQLVSGFSCCHANCCKDYCMYVLLKISFCFITDIHYKANFLNRYINVLTYWRLFC